MTVIEDGEDLEISTRAPRAKVEADDHVVLNGPVKLPGTAMYDVPQPEEFGTYDFMEDAELAKLGQEVIKASPNLKHLEGRSILYFWKKKGGTDGGRPRRGHCLKPSGLLYQLSNDTDWIVWLAADNCAGLTKHEVEGALFRQLCRAGQDDEGNRVLVQPDVYEFRVVLERYGPLESSTRAFVKTARQLSFEV